MKRTRQSEKSNPKLFLDSGAYSAYTQGKEIDLFEYIDFIKEHQSVLDVYANLDVIGDAEATLANQRTMEQAGLHPLPVYHLHDPMDYLHYYIDRYDYVAIGGMARGATSEARTLFLNKCFNLICDTPDRLPKVKIHGFGMTSLPLMLRYPWYSVDSTSWVLTGRFGGVHVPYKKNGEYDYGQISMKINVSSRSPSTKEEGQHFNTLPPRVQKNIREYFHTCGYVMGESEFHMEPHDYQLKEDEEWVSRSGAPEEGGLGEVEKIVKPGLTNIYQLRDELNIKYFKEFSKTVPEYPWPFQEENAKAGFGLV
jgi:hypothetical protein